MANAVNTLSAWITSLNYTERQEVLEYIYGSSVPFSMNLGASPMLKSLNLGAVPQSTSTPSVCPNCGKRL